jgi:hypothetical protein
MRCGDGRQLPKPARQKKVLWSVETGGLKLCVGILLVSSLCSCNDVLDSSPAFNDVAPGLRYANHREAEVPWSIHILQVDRSRSDLELLTVHARDTSLGLTTLSRQIASLSPNQGRVMAAINGDYFLMGNKTYAGDARGLQVVGGTLVSAPSDGICFWLDPTGRPHTDRVFSLFRVTWPDGSTNAFGLNEPVLTNKIVLFTPALGWSSTGTTNACELVLEPAGKGPWPFPVIGKTITVRVRQVQPGGNTLLTRETAVLAIDNVRAWKLAAVKPGDLLTLSFATLPSLEGVKTAIAGGPILIQESHRQHLKRPFSLRPVSFEFRSMTERHPRTAIGWNDHYYYLVQVDGRQPNLSAGMTLKELGNYMRILGCDEAMNLDGGGSSTMWCNGRVVNRPCERRERDIANSLILVRKDPSSTLDGSSTHPDSKRAIRQ